MRKELIFLLGVLFLIGAINMTSAVVINSAFADEISPGEQGKISIEIKNIFNEDVEEVSLNLDFKNLPFIPIGSSEQSTDEILSDDEENFVFLIKSAPDIKPGDYEIPYTLKYTREGDLKTSSGTIGVKVRAQPELVFTLNTQNNVLNQKGTIELKIVNQGFYEARFVSAKIFPSGFTLLSQEESYLGTVSSDDFETTSFDVVFKNLHPTFNAQIKYTDFDNKKITKNVVIPFEVYSEEKAKELRIIKPNYTFYYTLAAFLVIILFFVWRSINKRRKLKRSMRARSEAE